MAVFRIHKDRNFTVMSNVHFRDRALSLRAKGLLSLMLSLPDDWDYTIAGLVTLSKDGRDAVISAVRELEAAGYVRRSQRKDGKGRFSGYDYEVYETPTKGEKDALPSTSSPFTEFPNTGKPEQLSTDVKKDVTTKHETEEISEKKERSEILAASPSPSPSLSFAEQEDEPDELRALRLMDERETTPTGFTKSLIRGGYLEEGDLDIGDYNRFFARMVRECGDWALVRNAVSYFLWKVKRVGMKSVTDRYAYLTAAIRHGVERQITAFENAERQEAFLKELEAMKAERDALRALEGPRSHEDGQDGKNIEPGKEEA